MTDKPTISATGREAHEPNFQTIPMQKVQQRPDRYPEHGYHAFEALIASRVAQIKGPVFTTDADPDGLWNCYLGGIPEEFRQHYACNCCRRFIQRYGGLVEVNAEGGLAPVLWTKIGLEPQFFRLAVDRLYTRVVDCNAKVTGPFYWDDKKERHWGYAETWAGMGHYRWTHLHGTPPPQGPARNSLQTCEQAMAERRQEYVMLRQALADYPMMTAAEAARVLEADALDRSEKTLGVARWFLELHAKIEGAKGRRRDNLIWLAVATAPPGFCHVRSSMIGTLLDDIQAGLGYEEVSRRWATKMHPLRYQRPQAAPKAGNIDQAEKIVERLGIARSLERRFARMEDVVSCNAVFLGGDGMKQAVMPDGRRGMWMWSMGREKAMDNIRKGVFDDLRRPPIQPNKLILPPTTVTWKKFEAEVLPRAMEMELQAPSVGPYFGLLTAAHADAPPILQWDGLTEKKEVETLPVTVVEHPLPRNPVSWYFYNGGSMAEQWGLRGGNWVKVNAVFASPAHWQRPDLFRHHGEMAMFALEGARDRKAEGTALFPETLRNELREVRSVIEAHSAKTNPAGAEEGNANGYAVLSNKVTGGVYPYDLTLRVKFADGDVLQYRLDRWE